MATAAGALKLTPARRRALEVVANPGPLRAALVSNVTDRAKGFVYWQSADWLVAEGLAEWTAPRLRLRPTERGRAALEAS